MLTTSSLAIPVSFFSLNNFKNQPEKSKFQAVCPKNGNCGLHGEEGNTPNRMESVRIGFSKGSQTEEAGESQQSQCGI